MCVGAGIVLGAGPMAPQYSLFEPAVRAAATTNLADYGHSRAVTRGEESSPARTWLGRHLGAARPKGRQYFTDPGGFPALYQVILTNVGNTVDSYELSGAFPTGFTGVFGEQTGRRHLPGEFMRLYSYHAFRESTAMAQAQ